MIDIGNLFIAIILIIAFLFWIKKSIQVATKEELQKITQEMESFKRHCVTTINENAKDLNKMIEELQNDIKNIKK